MTQFQVNAQTDSTTDGRAKDGQIPFHWTLPATSGGPKMNCWSIRTSISTKVLNFNL